MKVTEREREKREKEKKVMSVLAVHADTMPRL